MHRILKYILLSAFLLPLALFGANSLAQDSSKAKPPPPTALQELVARKKFFSSAEIMIQATGIGGELLALSGKRNPYGKLGVVEAGAVADLLIYDANPLEDVAIAADPATHLELIIQGGKLIRNRF